MKISSTEPTITKFNIAVMGIDPQELQVRLVMKPTEKLFFVIPGRVDKSNMAIIEIPPTKGWLPAVTSIPAVLEVIGRNYYFVPWEGVFRTDDVPDVVVTASYIESELDDLENLLTEGRQGGTETNTAGAVAAPEVRQPASAFDSDITDMASHLMVTQSLPVATPPPSVMNSIIEAVDPGPAFNYTAPPGAGGVNRTKAYHDMIRFAGR